MNEGRLPGDAASAPGAKKTVRLSSYRLWPVSLQISLRLSWQPWANPFVSKYCA
jgi:hypothetical protein